MAAVEKKKGCLSTKRKEMDKQTIRDVDSNGSGNNVYIYCLKKDR